MKKTCISLLLIGIIVLSVIALFNREKPETEYLRLHIRADSNLEKDQAVKYAVRDAVVEFLTPIVADCDSKEKARKLIKDNLENIEETADRVLKNNGFEYVSEANLKSEEFPTRVYDDLTLNEGIYDALIIKLGSGEGDNWWCLIYPPLCFTSPSLKNIKYKSKIAEIIEKFYSR